MTSHHYTIATWEGDSARTFKVTAHKERGRLADPLPIFLKEWINNLEVGKSGRPVLPQELLTSKSLSGGNCYYTACYQPGHSSDHCHKLAIKVAEIGSVRAS